MPTCHSSKNGQRVLCVKVELERANNLAKHITEKVSLHELQFSKKQYSKLVIRLSKIVRIGWLEC